MDQSVQSLKILLPEIDRNQMKIEEILTINGIFKTENNFQVLICYMLYNNNTHINFRSD